MSFFLPRGAAWREALETNPPGPGKPGWEEELFDAVSREMDRFHSMGLFERREPAFRILNLLADWAGRWQDAGSPYLQPLLSVWNPVQGWLVGNFVDLFAGEAAVVSELPRHRFVTMQSLDTNVGVFLFHRESWLLGAGHLTPRLNPEEAVWSIIHSTGTAMRGGWDGPKMTAWIMGGRAREAGTLVASIESVLQQADVPESSVRKDMSLRSEDAGPLHAVFDRTEGAARPFHPSFDPVHFNLRTLGHRNRCLVERDSASPSLLWLWNTP